MDKNVFEIIYSDNDIVVLIKPVGLDSEKQLPDKIKEMLSGEVYTVHRLDKNVGGVMVYGRTKKAAAMLSKAIQNGEMIKEYVAMVHGVPPIEGDWTDYLFKDASKNKVFVVKRIRKGVKEARLEYKRISEDQLSKVRIRLHTGRSHQIRVQFASRGYPLAGDRKYGGKDDFEVPRLFSCKISFPYKGEMVAFEALPVWF
ncbi:MAG: RNA pseudouridine synthase [Ruminococcaceae bacterium]|nr:RNA pseudouridine synthase [Oscillospiraceae bacterium]